MAEKHPGPDTPDPAARETAGRGASGVGEEEVPGPEGAQDTGAPSRGILRRAAGAVLEEFSRPRARVRRALRRTRENVRAVSIRSVVGWALLAVAPFPLYAMGVGAARGAAGACAFLGSFVAVAVGGPVLLVYAWPVLAAGAVGLLLWGTRELGAGAAWLWAATVSAGLILYLASAEMAPFVGAACVARLALEIGRVPAIVAFVLSLALFYWGRRRLAASILAAAWSVFAGAAAARAAWPVLSAGATGDVPQEWAHGVLPGPKGLLVWVVAMALLSTRLVWRRPRGSETEQAEAG